MTPYDRATSDMASRPRKVAPPNVRNFSLYFYIRSLFLDGCSLLDVTLLPLCSLYLSLSARQQHCWPTAGSLGVCVCVCVCESVRLCVVYVRPSGLCPSPLRVDDTAAGGSRASARGQLMATGVLSWLSIGSCNGTSGCTRCQLYIQGGILSKNFAACHIISSSLSLFPCSKHFSPRSSLSPRHSYGRPVPGCNYDNSRPPHPTFASLP